MRLVDAERNVLEILFEEGEFSGDCVIACSGSVELLLQLLLFVFVVRQQCITLANRDVDMRFHATQFGFGIDIRCESSANRSELQEQPDS